MEFYFSVNGRVRTDFDPTPIISTYTVAFIISDLDYTESNATNNEHSIKHRVFSIRDDLNQTLYALNLGMNVLQALEHYLQVPYVLEKMDQYPIPGYFGDGMR